MKTLVPQHSSLPFVSWKEDYCAGAAASRDLQSMFSVDGTHAKCTVTQEAGKGDSHSYSSTRGEGKTESSSPPLSLSAIWCEDPSQRHLGAH